MGILKRLRWTIVGIGVLIGASIVYLALNPHWVKIENVSVDLSSNSKENLLFQRIDTSLKPQFQRFVGKYFWEVPLAQVFDIVSKDKRVRKVSVYREFPSRLRVEVEPRTPVLAYLSGDNRIYPVASDATLLPAITVSDVPDLPVLRGEELKDEQALRETALELFDLFPNEGSLRKKNISEISYTKKEGFKIFLSGAGAEVKMGETDFGPKIPHVEQVLSYLESQNIKGRVIDARFTKKVVVRVRNSP